MSNEARELNQHIDWLKDQLDYCNSIETQLDEIKDDVDQISHDVSSLWNSVEGLCGILKDQIAAQKQLADAFLEQSAGQRRMADAFLKLVDVLAANRPAAPSPAPPAFNAMFDEMAKQTRPSGRTTRQKFKPKIVNNDEADKPKGAP
jgi:hypothetical protein